MASKLVLNKRSRDPKTYTITLRMSDLVWLGVGTALTLSIFFLFGLLIGRGYVATAPLEGDPEAAMHAEAEGAANATQEEQKPLPVVLQPEDLNYPEKIGQTEPAPEPGDAGSAEQAAAEQAGQTQPEAQSEAQSEAQTETADAPGGEDGGFDVGEPQPGEEVYDYIYQVAAFKEEAQAEALRDALTAKRMDAEVAEASVNGQVWHRVRVRFTGTPSQTEPLRGAIEDVTGQKPIRVSKKLASG